MLAHGSLCCVLLMASSGCNGALDSDALGGGGRAPSSDGGSGGALGNGGGAPDLPYPPPACPSESPPSCLTPTETALELWLDVPTALGFPARIVAIQNGGALVQTEPESGPGQPLLVGRDGDEIVITAVVDPHEAELRAVAMAWLDVVLCGDESCHVYAMDADGMHDSGAPAVPLTEDAIAGAMVIGDIPSGGSALFCVYGDGIVCLEGSSWIPIAPPGDRLLAVGGSTYVDTVFAGENGRMGRLVRWPDTEATPIWTELERKTASHLRASAGWLVAGDDGVVVTVGDDATLLCSTGDQDWTTYAGRLISESGDILYFKDPELAMAAPCMRSGPSDLSYVAATSYTDGTTWGIRLATETQIFTQMTGFTE